MQRAGGDDSRLVECDSPVRIRVRSRLQKQTGAANLDFDSIWRIGRLRAWDYRCLDDGCGDARTLVRQERPVIHAGCVEPLGKRQAFSTLDVFHDRGDGLYGRLDFSEFDSI